MQAPHPILARRVQFDLSHSPLHWLPHDPEASYIINSIHLLLPAGEFWFCRVYNKVLPLITDPALRTDVHGFIRQEAMHARMHDVALDDYLRAHGVEVDTYVKVAEFLFEQLLGDHFDRLPRNAFTRRLDAWWLRQRVGLIAAIEHFTCVFGKWVVESDALNAANADPVLLDLFRWHGAEEVEHRNVAHDLHVHLGGTALERQLWAVIAFPTLFGLLGLVSSHMMRQDPGVKPNTFLRRWRQGGQRGTLPSVESIAAAAVRYFSPGYHPDSEAPLSLAQDYFAKSPAVQAALAKSQAAATNTATTTAKSTAKTTAKRAPAPTKSTPKPTSASGAISA